MFGGDTRHEVEWADAALRRYHDRHARRESLGEGEDLEDRDWLTLENGHRMLRIHEGSLIARPNEDVRRGYWSLYMQWNGHPGARLLTTGPRSELERLARRIEQVGPPGGPDFVGPGPKWWLDDDGTEHAVTIGGELRLMPPVMDDGDGVLLRAHNDRGGSVSVLGVGEHDPLQNDADELDGRAGARLRLSIGGRDRYLQVLGADGIVGHLDLGDDLFVLAHLGGDEFGLASESGGIHRAIRTYSLEEVMRGDLGRVEGWADSRILGDTSPPRRAARRAPSERRTRRGTARSRRRVRHAAPRTPARLSGEDLIKALRHLTPENDCTGDASTVIPKILNIIRAAIQVPDLGNKIALAKKLLDFLAEHTGQEIHCCMKILNIALRRIAAKTKLLVRRNRRWELRLGDLRALNSALLQEMIEAGPIDLDRKPGSKKGKKHPRPRTPPAAEPEVESAPVAEGAPPSAPSLDTPPQASTTPPASPPADGSPPSPPTDLTSSSPPADEAPSSPPADEAPSSPPADEAPSSPPAAAATPAAETFPTVSTPSAAPSAPPCGTDETCWYLYVACDSADGPPTAPADMAAPTVLAPIAPIGKMSAPPPVRRPRRPELDPAFLASMGFPASTSYEQLAAVYLAEVKRSQPSIGLHPGNYAIPPQDDARFGMPARAAADLAGPELRSPGGWIRRGAGRRNDRPP
jgi:hypothetical protein